MMTKKERNRIRQTLDNCAETAAVELIDELTDEIKRLQELERDAGRYRWLSDKANFARKSASMVCLHPLDQQELIDGERLDVEIDAAMQAEGEQQ
jgi:hypothetical protein